MEGNVLLESYIAHDVPVFNVAVITSSEAIEQVGLEAGAADFEADGPALEITCDPDAFNDVVKALEGKGYAFASAEIEMVPQNYITLTGEGDVKNMEKLIDMLEDNDDVQNVWHNWDND